MKYRALGKLNWEVSELGFGAMRLPIVANDSENVDEDEAIRMRGLHYAYKKGVAVVVMEPIKGGHLLRPPKRIGVNRTG